MDDIYFIKDGDGKQAGPFTPRQLQGVPGFCGDTLTRNAADTDWMTAREISSLAEAVKLAGVTQAMPPRPEEPAKETCQKIPTDNKSVPETQDLNLPPRQRRQHFLNIDPQSAPGAKPKIAPPPKAGNRIDWSLPKPDIEQMSWLFYACGIAWLALNLFGYFDWMSEDRLRQALIALGGGGGFALGAVVIVLLTQIRNQARLIVARQAVTQPADGVRR